MFGITDYLWRLVPANPILLRVVQFAGKRRRDLAIRCAYLGLLLILVIVSLINGGASSGGQGGTSLRDLAIQSSGIFQQLSYLQLGLVALLAPIFTAGAITQEKDSHTYDILLSTPLTNGQIVLGSLLSRLFFVIALLVSGIPVFSITQIFGGVAIGSIMLSFGIAAATALVTAALAMAIAVLKVGTRRTIFSFYLFVVIYLVGVFLLDRLDFFKIPLGFDPNKQQMILSKTGWLTGLHPFLALRVIFNDESYLPPALADLPQHLRAWPIGWYLTSPQTFYITFMILFSVVLVLPSIALLRRLAQSTLSPRNWLMQKLHLSTGDRTRKPRVVWHNPVAWREAKTKASAARASFMRYGFILAGLAGAVILLWMYCAPEPYDRFVTADSYDPQHALLYVYDARRAQTCSVSPNADIRAVQFNQADEKYETVAFSLADLTGKMAVKELRFMPDGRTVKSLLLADIPHRVTSRQARGFLLGAVVVEFAVILLIVANAAASTVTREKEDGTLDLLLSSPITSRYYIWGKLRGLVSFMLPLLAVPVASLLIFIFADAWRFATQPPEPHAQWLVFPEGVLVLPGILIIVTALTAILGMNLSLRCRTTVRAVMSAVGIIVAACGGLGWCGYSLLTSGREGGGIFLAFSSLSPFTVLTVLIDPYSYGGSCFDSGVAADVFTGRCTVFIAAWAATLGYGFLVWMMYKSMVKNFDMTIRRQSR